MNHKLKSIHIHLSLIMIECLLNFSFQSNRHCVTLIDEEYGNNAIVMTILLLLLQLLAIVQSEGQALSKLHQFWTSIKVKNLPGMYMLMKRYIFDLLVHVIML